MMAKTYFHTDFYIPNNVNTNFPSKDEGKKNFVTRIKLKLKRAKLKSKDIYYEINIRSKPIFCKLKSKITIIKAIRSFDKKIVWIVSKNSTIKLKNLLINFKVVNVLLQIVTIGFLYVIITQLFVTIKLMFLIAVVLYKDIPNAETYFEAMFGSFQKTPESSFNESYSKFIPVPEISTIPFDVFQKKQKAFKKLKKLLKENPNLRFQNFKGIYRGGQILTPIKKLSSNIYDSKVKLAGFGKKTFRVTKLSIKTIFVVSIITAGLLGPINYNLSSSLDVKKNLPIIHRVANFPTKANLELSSQILMDRNLEIVNSLLVKTEIKTEFDENTQNFVPSILGIEMDLNQELETTIVSTVEKNNVKKILSIEQRVQQGERVFGLKDYNEPMLEADRFEIETECKSIIYPQPVPKIIERIQINSNKNK